MRANVFSYVPNELKTIEVDVEKRIFKVNGESFGEGCTSFTIHCDACDGYKLQMYIDTTVHLASYNMQSGKKETGHTYHMQPADSKE